MSKPSISIALIARNEVHNLPDFFKTIEPICDELVVADTGSTDETLAQVEKWKAKAPYPVIAFSHAEMPFHFGKARNETIKRATKDYIFLLDADERLSPGFISNIKDFLAEKKPIAVTMQRQDDITPHLVDPQTRIIKNHEGILYATDLAGQLHEHLLLPKPAANFDDVIIHHQGKGHWVNDHDRFFILLMREVARATNNAGFFREFIRANMSFFYTFRKEYIRKKTYLDGKIGFKYSFLRAFHAYLFHFFVGLKPRTQSHDKNND